jgi:hypothetical protein
MRSEKRCLLKTVKIEKKLKKESIKEKSFSEKFPTNYHWKEGLPKDHRMAKEEHLIPWILSGIKKGFKIIPKHLKTLAIFGSIILIINVIFWQINTYFMPAYLQPFSGIIKLIVFLTATYNNILPKTIFWGIVFTFGRRLFKAVKKRGFKKAFACMQLTIPKFKEAFGRLNDQGYPILITGIGIGLIVANNFASYSRFSGARNKFDKYFVVIVIAFAISYLLGEARQSGLFKFVKLASNDLSNVLLKKDGLSDDGVYVLLSGFVIGLILDAPLIAIKFMYGGYILGLLALVAALGLGLKSKTVKGS